MRGVLVVAGLLGCGRLGFEPPDLLPLGDPGALALCAHAVAPMADGYLVAWLEHPPAEARIRMSASIVSDGYETPLAMELASDLPRLISLSIAIVGRPDHHIVFVGGRSLLRAVSLDGAGGLVAVHEETTGPDYDSLVVLPAASGLRLFFRYGSRIYQQTLDDTGAPQGVAIRLDAVDLTQEAPHGASTSVGFLVAWQEYNAGWRVRLAAVADDGASAPSVLIDDRGRGQFSPRVIANDSGGYTVVWVESGGVFARDVAADATPLAMTRQVVFDTNRAESFTYDAAGTAGSAAVAWESDSETVLPRIIVQSLTSGVAPRSLTDPKWQFLCPRVGLDGGAVTMRGSAEGRAQIYLREIRE